MKFRTNITLSIMAGTIVTFGMTAYAAVKQTSKTEHGAIAYKYDSGDVAQVMLLPNQHVVCEGCGQQPLLANYVEPPVKKLKLNPMPVDEEDARQVKGESKSPELPKEEKEQVLATIRFAFNSAKLTKASMEEIAKVAKVIKELPAGGKAVIKVDGYTCKVGGKKYNDKLARRRAEAVAGKLKSLGVQVSQVAGEGICCYVSKIDKRNRRAEVSLTGKEGAK